MKPIKWADANTCLVPAVDGTRPGTHRFLPAEEVQKIPYDAGLFVLRMKTPRGLATVSCWQLTDAELEKIAKTRCMYLVVNGNEMKGVDLAVDKPYELLKPDDPRLGAGGTMHG